MDLTEVQERIKELAKRAVSDHTINANQVGSAVGSPGQAMRKRRLEMFALVLPGYDVSRMAIIDVGDNTRDLGEGYNIALSLPVASDVWYLTVGESILPYSGENYQQDADTILAVLSKYLSNLGNIEPLRSLHSYKDLSPNQYLSPSRGTWEKGIGRQVIRTIRYEAWMFNRSTEFPSKGPKASAEAGVYNHPENSMGELYCGFLSIPVGPLGVMQVLSIYSENMPNMHFLAMDESVVIESADFFAPVLEQPLDGFMSPMTDMKETCPGVHLVEKGYLNVSRDAEYPAEAMEKYDTIKPLMSLRFYLRRGARWPLPGEFIGVLAKPWPTHVWWFQKTSPFLYAGNWFETNFYTSGIITEVLTPLEGSPVKVYRVTVRGCEICISASDFYGYKVGDRVAILRTTDIDRGKDETKGNFKWKELEDLFARAKRLQGDSLTGNEYLINGNMMIVPMSFYQTIEYI